ncbi:MAG: aminotransferase class I/II-fold pyridoxal phosphate-dependent enzyme, partial [Caldilinea sp.]|nr:aminotransferase class I/II-fold pyridoxal phosphate-dependent enzyme [Caldilinea sp.]
MPNRPTTDVTNQPDRPGSTTAVHAGERPFRSHNSLTVPIVQTAVYTFDTTEELVTYTEERLFWSEPEREEYGRYGNPTVRAVEAKIAALEGAQDAIVVSSGMAAVTATLLMLLQPGQHFILTDNCYHSTLEFSQGFLKRYGIACSLVPFGDYAAIEQAIRPETRLIFSESPTNPFMRCLDFERLVELAQRHNVLTVVDSTFATPFNLQPLRLG